MRGLNRLKIKDYVISGASIMMGLSACLLTALRAVVGVYLILLGLSFFSYLRRHVSLRRYLGIIFFLCFTLAIGFVFRSFLFDIMPTTISRFKLINEEESSLVRIDQYRLFLEDLLDEPKISQ